ncbi:MAG TPA: hypothetical protein VMZ73_04380 [Acidimicrobiales bacterium]|nr:hypothetical protein [Acidimicrobiales bacterium]
MSRWPRAALTGVLLCASAAFGVNPARGTQVTAVSGGAFGHWTKVSLFGGPSVPVGPIPDVRLPPEGSAEPITARESGGSAVYGPAHIFGGIWPATGVDIAPPSGPIVVTTKGTPGPNGSVTSTVDITLRTPADPKSPGGWGPLPPTQGEEMHTTCTANQQGVTGSTRLKGAVMSKATTPVGEPIDEEPVPDNPPVNYTRTGVLTNVGDRYRIVYNEHIIDPDGSLTVNGVHMYLLGDIAVGDQIIGQVRCSVKGAAFANTPPTVVVPPESKPTVGAPPPTGPAPTQPAPFAGDQPGLVSALPTTDSESNTLPYALLAAAGVVLVGGGIAALAVRRGSRDSGRAPPA